MAMKKLLLQVLILSFVLSFITGCKDGLFDELINRTGLVKIMQLKKMVYNGRHYEFFYDSKGRIDYIDVNDESGFGYVYDVTYNDRRLSSASLVEGGVVISENHDFKFDKMSNIIGFTYSLYDDNIPGGVHNIDYDFQYDQWNRFIGNPPDYSYSYDDHDNIIKWTTTHTETTYTYDDRFNPLNPIPDLFAILVEEHFYWEYIFSRHNAVTRAHIPDISNPQVHHVMYTNEYDKFHRLIRKTDNEGNEFLFLYKE